MEETKHKLTVEALSDGRYWRLDAYLANKYPEKSRSFFQNLIAAGKVTVNGSVATKSVRLRGGEELTWVEPQKEKKPVAQNIPLDVIYEDGDIIVINKPAGLVVHPACGHPDNTLLNALFYLAKDKYFPYLVHRLDKDTTGILVVAKNETAKLKLIQQFQRRTVEKTYVAVVKGVIDYGRAYIDAPLGRSARNRFVVEVGAGAKKNSTTEMRKIKAAKDYTVVEVMPKTGRTHQIRAHFAYIKHPVLGDAVYGGSCSQAQRPMLHAYHIKFIHPSTGKKVEFTAPLPDDIKRFME